MRVALVRARPGAGSRRVVSTRAQYEPPASTSQLGDRLLPLLRTPFDALALGPRVTLGALASLPQLLQQLPEDLEKVSALIQDPRSLEQKQVLVLEEVEARVAEYLERGASAEREALSTLSAALPEPLRDALPDRLREALTPATAPTAAAPGAPGAPGSSFSSVVAPEGWTSSNGAKPVATWTFSGSDDEGYGPAVVITAAELTASQTAAEVSEVRSAVVALRESLEELRGNADTSRTGMLRLNLNEARAALDRRLGQLQGGGAGGDVAEAVAEAATLLQEVEALP